MPVIIIIIIIIIILEYNAHDSQMYIDIILPIHIG